MSYLLRAARHEDLPTLLDMAQCTGGGLTNLPADQAKLTAKLATADAAWGRVEDALGDDMFLFILENMQTGQACGTCQVFSRIGKPWPFYSYRIDSFATYSKEFGHSIDSRMLTLSTELGGCCEVGGLYLHPAYRAAGVGSLLARSRYLFIRGHRARFACRAVAELRGVVDEAGKSPFWEGLAAKFFGIGFHEADEFNAIHGNQFIADLMPKNPIYTALLSDSVTNVMGMPHQSSRAAMRMLETEGFRFENHIDIFDGGPTMTVATDDIATVRDAQQSALVSVDDEVDGVDSIVACGRLGEFRSCYATVSAVDGGILLNAETAKALHASPGDCITHVAR